MTDNTGAVLLGDVLDVAKLGDAIEAGLIMINAHPERDLFILGYTNQAQFDRVWTHETKTCRGLIVKGDPRLGNSEVVSRPFAKFANAAEHGEGSVFGELPTHQTFEAFEKLDGSLAILYHDGEEYALATRGSFVSDQARVANRVWRERYGDVVPPEGVTLLFEFIAPWNRIVVNYGLEEDLVLLAAIDTATGADVTLPEWPGRVARRYDEFSDFSELAAFVGREDMDNAEGFVVRFIPEDEGVASVRAKLKFAEYLRLHKLVTGVNSLAVWENLSKGLDLDELIGRVPDEFFEFVTSTAAELRAEQAALVAAARRVASGVAGMDRKAAAGVILAQSEAVPFLVFGVLDEKDVDELAWRMVKPEFTRPFFNMGSPD